MKNVKVLLNSFYFKITQAVGESKQFQKIKTLLPIESHFARNGEESEMKSW